MAEIAYELGELLGSGGMGQVHASRDRSGRKVAVKRVHDTLANDQLFIDRLIEEARLLENVQHPNVVRALGLGARDGLPFLVMDRVAGAPLGDVISGEGALPLSRTMVIAAQILAGLTAIHDAKVIHADLKSNNILVDEVDVVTIIDFGLARRANALTESNGFVAGTPAYMAPEVIDGAQPTIESDIYAAATIVYEMLTGSTPFAGTLANILARQVSEAIELPSLRTPSRGITAAVDRVLLRALSRHPAARYHYVADFAADLAEAFATMPVVAEDSFDEQYTVMRLFPAGSGLHPTRRSPDHAIADALELAHRHIAQRDLAGAAAVLDTALAALTGPEIEICAAMWRIELLAASVHESLGNFERAARIARCAYRRAMHSGCKIAEKKTREAVERHASPRRIARGSTSVPVVRRRYAR